MVLSLGFEPITIFAVRAMLYRNSRQYVVYETKLHLTDVKLTTEHIQEWEGDKCQSWSLRMQIKSVGSILWCSCPVIWPLWRYSTPPAPGQVQAPSRGEAWRCLIKDHGAWKSQKAVFINTLKALPPPPSHGVDICKFRYVACYRDIVGD